MPGGTIAAVTGLIIRTVGGSTAEEPLGDRIGPFVFWPLLVLLLGLLVWAMRRLYGGNRTAKGGGARRASDAGDKDWTKPEDYAEHHRVAWDENPASFEPAPIHWPLAVAAVLGICTGDPWDRLRFESVDTARAGLQEAWGIRSRPQLLSQLHWLLREGHRVGFAREVEGWSALAPGGRARRLRGADDTQEARERAWRMQQVRANARGIRDANFEAWDLARAAMLCRAGHSLGWLSEEEALDTMHLLSASLQRGYSAWEEFGAHFALAHWCWGAASGIESRQEEAHEVSRQRALLEPQRGPWSRVLWTQPLPESRVLLAEALVSEELIVDPPAGSPTPLAMIIDDAVAARLRSERS